MTIAMWCSTSSTREVELVADRADELAELVDLGVGETGGRLVEQQQPRLRRERAGDLDALERAVRQADGGPVGEVRERRGVRGSRSASRAPRSRRTGRASARRPCTFSSTVSAGNSARFWNVRAMPTLGDAVRRQREQVVAVEVDAPAVGW